jgi:hypothetical protein
LFYELAALKPSAYMGVMVGGGASDATSRLTVKNIIRCKEAKVKKILLLSFVVALLCTGTGTSLAVDWGTGPGCSAIGDVDVTALTSGDTFTGRIGTTGVSGFNKQGAAADDTDADGLTDSMESCINDALYGHCGDIDTDDSVAITVTPLDTKGNNNNKQWFTVTFFDVSGCAVTACSDHADNDGDLLIDYPEDPDCADYSDNTEAP